MNIFVLKRNIMKKLIFIFCSGILLVSCAKDYTCNCTSTVLPEESYTITAKKESDAESTCNSYADGTGGLVSCSLE